MKNTPFRYLKRHSKKFKMSLNSLGGGEGNRTPVQKSSP